jgi:hypothetical protein
MRSSSFTQRMPSSGAVIHQQKMSTTASPGSILRRFAKTGKSVAHDEQLAKCGGRLHGLHRFADILDTEPDVAVEIGLQENGAG